MKALWSELTLCLALGSALFPVSTSGQETAPTAPEGRLFAVGAGATAADDASAKAHLLLNSGRYGIPPDPLDLVYAGVRESLLGRHFLFQQCVDGIPVLGAAVTVSAALTNHAVYRVSSSTCAVKNRSGRALLDSEAALDRAWAQLAVRGRLHALPRASLVWTPAEGGLRLAYRAEIACSDPLGTWETLVDAETGRVLSSRNRMRTDSRKRGGQTDGGEKARGGTGSTVSRAGATAAFLAETGRTSKTVQTAGAAILADTVAQGWGWVFDPDPKTTLNSDALSDSSAASAFIPAMVLRPLRDITLNAGVYRLTGPWVTIANFDAPATAPSTTADGVWNFPRGNNGLNDAIVYFHIDQSQRYLQALGYTGGRGIQDRSIPADSDGDSGADNSYFDPTGNRVSFGHGGVDDSEDADVILHEYGHAIEYGINPAFDGGDTGAIGEGFGDYWAGSYSLSCSNGAVFHPDWVFTWDGHNEFWAGRVLNSTGLYTPGATYGAHAYVGGVLGDELWSAPLFQSLKRLLAAGRSREEADTVVIESHFGMGYGTRIPMMASNVVATALALYPDGPHAGIFYSEFTNRNILTRWALEPPTVVFPPGGESLVTGSLRHIRWIPGPAPVSQGAVVEFAEQAPNSVYWQNDVEGGAAGWTVSHGGGTLDWKRVTTTHHSPVTSWWADEQSIKVRLYLVSPSITLSNGTVFGFWHQFNVQANYDGGVVEVSTNGGAAWVDVTTNVMAEGYSTLRQINPAASSAIKGRMAFSGSSGGFVHSMIDLSMFGGKTAKIRFLLATDASVRAAAPRGWWVDDMTLAQESWEAVGVAGQGEDSIVWAPPRPLTGAVVRVKSTATGCVDSAWAMSGVFSVSVDVDADALPDDWEIAQFASLAASSGTNDTDGDGSSDYAEWIAGTCPTQTVSVLRMVDVATAGTGSVAVGWTSVTGRCYTVEWTGSLVEQPFVAAVSNILAVPATNRTSTPVGGGATGALRVKVQP